MIASTQGLFAALPSTLSDRLIVEVESVDEKGHQDLLKKAEHADDIASAPTTKDFVVKVNVSLSHEYGIHDARAAVKLLLKPSEDVAGTAMA